MKWSVQQLNKYTNTPYHFQGELDLSENIKNIPDIFNISSVFVEGEITCISYNTYRMKYSFKVDLELQCSLTLLPTNYHMEKSYDEVFSTEANDDHFLIEKNTLNLDEIVWSMIVIEKPLAVKRDDAYEILEKQGIKLNESIEDILDSDEEVEFESFDEDGKEY